MAQHKLKKCRLIVKTKIQQSLNAEIHNMQTHFDAKTWRPGITYLLNVLSITKHANLHLWARDVRQLNRTTETLVLLRVIVLQSNLQLNGFNKLALLLARVIGN